MRCWFSSHVLLPNECTQCAASIYYKELRDFVSKSSLIFIYKKIRSNICVQRTERCGRIMCLGKVEEFRIKDEIRSQDKAAVSELPRAGGRRCHRLTEIHTTEIESCSHSLFCNQNNQGHQMYFLLHLSVFDF